ncbi:MAG: AMP-binding protein, partial [Pseudomonadota bacterium]
DAQAVLNIIDRYKVSVSQFVPTHFQRLLALPDDVKSKFDGSSLRVAVHAAAPCPAHVKRAMIEWWGPVLLEYYAGTEGGGVRIDSKQWLEKPGSVGKTWAGLSVAIRSPTGEMTDAADLEGPIYFRNDAGGAPNFAYYKDEEKTKNAYCGDWFTLGDIGYLDNDGFLFLTDRASNLIISGGVNIYPQEIEDALSAHPKVHDVAVIGTPDPDFGEAVTAVVVPTPGEAPGPALEAELIDYAKAKFASFKCPRSVQFTDDLPRTETGKLLKRKLKDVYG